MISALNKTPNKVIDSLRNETDKLLSDKYILAKEIRDLNKTLLDSTDAITELEVELKNKVQLNKQLVQFINLVEGIKNKSGFQVSKYKVLNQLIDKYNSEQDLRKLKENLKIDKSDILQVKLLIMENILTLTDEIKILREKTESIKNANTEVQVEKDNLKAQLKNIEDEIAGNISKEE